MIKADKRFLVYPAAFFVNAGITMLNFSYIFFLRRTYGTSPALIGWMSAFWAAAYLAGCIGLGGVSRRLSYRGALPVATATMGLSALAIFLIPSEAAALAGYMLFGLITALHWPPLMGWLSEGLEGVELNRWVGGFNLSWSTGAGAGPFIAGLLIERSISLAFWAITGLYLLVSIIYLTVFRVAARRARRVETEIPEETPAIEDRSSPLRFAGWIGVASSYLLLGAVMFIFPMYAEDVLGYSESYTGLLLFLRGAVTVAGFYAAGRTLFWHHNTMQILFSQLLLAGTGLWMAFAAGGSDYLLLFALFGLIFALQYATSIFHGVSGALERERRMAVHEGALTFGVMLGSAGGGILYQYFSFRAVLLIISAVILAAGVLQYLSFVLIAGRKKGAAA